MKLKAVFRIIIFISIWVVSITNLYANDKIIEEKLFKKLEIEYNPILELDSIPVKRSADKREQERPFGETKPGENSKGTIKPGERGPHQDIKKENPRIRQNSGIKQVPRSIPKLKPKTIRDRIPIRRVPQSIPKRGIVGFH